MEDFAVHVAVVTVFSGKIGAQSIEQRRRNPHRRQVQGMRLHPIVCAACTAAFVPIGSSVTVNLARTTARSHQPLLTASTLPLPNLEEPEIPLEVATSFPEVSRMRGGRTISASQVTLLGAAVNVLLSLLKFVVGTLSGSVSLVADAYHSGSVRPHPLERVQHTCALPDVPSTCPRHPRLLAILIFFTNSSVGAGPAC